MSSSNLHRPDQENIPFSRPETPAERLRLAFVGIGAMGHHMARNLASSKSIGPHPLLVWNRTKEKADALLNELGPSKIEVAKDLAYLAAASDIILINLANDAAVTAVYEEMTSSLAGSTSARTKVFVETSTIFPALVGELEKLVNRVPHGRLVTAPVFGAPAAADKAQLVIVTSGDYRSKKEIGHLLVPAMGRKIIDLGGNLEKAPTLKLIGNSMILGMMEVMAESFTLAEKAGIGADRTVDIVKELFPNPILVNYADKMMNDKFDGTKGFAIDGGIKDAQHIRRLTSEHNSPMPVIDVAHQHLITARALHGANKQNNIDTFETLDWSAIIASSRIAAGLDAFDTGKHEQLVRESQ